jgi:gamma-glutamyltranspeptidase/glutathione hydrolase
MDDFTTKPGAVKRDGAGAGRAQRDRGRGKRMLSSMTPTIVLDSAGALELVTGAAGGAYIITGVAHQIVSLMDFHRRSARPMAAPQFHFQDQPDSLIAERVAWADTAAGVPRAAGPRGEALAVGEPGEHAEHPSRGGEVAGREPNRGASDWPGATESRLGDAPGTD